MAETFEEMQERVTPVPREIEPGGQFPVPWTTLVLRDMHRRISALEDRADA